MGEDFGDKVSGKLPMEIGELGLGVTNHEKFLDSDCLHRVTTNCGAMPNESKNTQKDESFLKRDRQVDNEQTSVQIIYKLLSRKSKKKLEELLHQWSEWHAQECSLSEGSNEDLESGDKTYFPSLNVGTDKSCTISVYMDYQVKKKQRTEDAQFNKDSVPVYDRDFSHALMSTNGLANKESVLDLMNDSRCFNCDAYDHSLKECPKPLNKEVVSNARKLYQLKSKRSGGPRFRTRYFQNTPGGKFDGLKPGCLDLETRKLLCIGEFDPPPWLNRMREMGYPPGYLDLENEEQPSGIIIFDNEDTKEDNEECVNTNFTEPKRKMTVDFPGINGPIPVNGDKNRWAAVKSQSTGLKSCSKNWSLNLNLNLDHRVESLSEVNICQSQRPNWLSHSHQSYALRFPLLSNYAKSYWDYINQPSSYACQNSWSYFHG